ncbi:MAG TPA: FtsX-like permease family protein, partial [Blastocatellia bacterium]
PANVPRAGEIQLDNIGLLFTCGVSLFASAVFGLLPALAASQPEVQEAIKEGGRNAGAKSQRARSLLVVAEMALSLSLLIGAGLMIRTFINLHRVDPGFRTNNLLTMSVTLPANKYREPQQKAAFFQQVIERIEALPGVQAVGAVSDLPLRGEGEALGFIIEGRPAATQDHPSAAWRAVTVDYFRAMGMRVVRGRAFTEQDKPGAPEPALINETLARRFWPGEDPIGKRLQVYDGDLLPWREVVGVVNDIKQSGLHSPAMPEIYVPFLQRPWAMMTLVAHTTGAPEQLGAAMRAAVQSVDKEQPVYRVRTMSQYFSDAVAAPRATMFLLGAFAVAALLLAAVGIYGVTGYAVTERTREIGVRLALGAQRGEVQWMVIRQGMKLTLLGVGIGLGSSFALTPWMETLLFGVLPTDPLTFTVIAAVLALVALLACWIPARRATKVDPLIALRHE